MADHDIDAPPGKPNRSRKRSRQGLLDALHALTTEGSGLCSLVFYSRDDIAGLKERVLAGEQRAWDHFRAIGQILGALNARRPPICLLCSAAFDEDEPPELIAVLQGYCDSPTHTISNAICARCAGEHPTQAALRAAIVGFYREHTDADLRVLPSAPFPPGHA